MTRLQTFLARVPWSITLVLCATLGLAPFLPEPHVWEKLKMLFAGRLTQPLDIFDFLFHGGPWLLLALKVAVQKKTPPT